MRNKYTITDLQRYAEDRGGRCLSTEYINSHTKYLWQDEKGNQWEAKWYSILNGRWSPYSAQSRKAAKLQKYSIQYCQELASARGGRCLSDTYVRTKDLILWEDSKGRQFQMRLENVLVGQWSPFEKAEKISELKLGYTIQELNEFAKKYGWECISEDYTGTKISYLWKSPWGKVYKKPWCDVQRKGLRVRPEESRQETEVAEFIESLGVKIIRNSRKIIKPFEIDIFCPELNIAIEYNGVRWHAKDKSYHLNKTKRCETLGIELIQIFDKEWETGKHQVMSFLQAKLGKNSRRIFARKTKVVLVPKIEANNFLKQYHMLKSVNHIQAFGLEYEGELVSLVTIGYHHRDSKQLVLSRYVGKQDVSVVGGLSKLSVAAKNYFNANIVTWVDKRMSNGSNWQKAGWKVDKILPPDYFYYDMKTKVIIPKQRRKKSVVGTPKNMTEREHADLDGLLRIYDCGKVRLTF